jgi:hypothetical protein
MLHRLLLPALQALGRVMRLSPGYILLPMQVLLWLPQNHY